MRTVQRVMQKYGWQCRVKIKKHKRTGQPAYIAANLLARDFSASKPLEKLVTDIKYGQTMMYLSSILDVYNGEIVEQTIGFKQDTDFVLDTLNQLPELPEGVFCIVTKVPIIHPMLIKKQSKKKELS